MQEILLPGERTSSDDRLRHLEALADLMDSRFVIPHTNIRIGFDAVLGLLPVLGDMLSAVISYYIVREAKSFGLPRHVLARMHFNVFVDWAVGSVPIAGDLFDIGWKANKMNVALIRKHLKKGGAARR